MIALALVLTLLLGLHHWLLEPVLELSEALLELRGLPWLLLAVGASLLSGRNAD